MINLHISCFENRVDPDQLASQKRADQDPHYGKYMLINGILQIYRIKNGEECDTQIYRAYLEQLLAVRSALEVRNICMLGKFFLKFRGH